MQILSIQSFDTGRAQRAHGCAKNRGGIGPVHFLRGVLVTPPTTMRVGPTPALVEASRAIRDATVRILVLEQVDALEAPVPAAEPSACLPRSAPSGLDGPRELAERLVQWAAPAEGRLVGSFTCSISRLVCNLVGIAPMVRHADERRFCRNALPLGFTFLAATGTSAAREAIVGLLADSRHPFQSFLADCEVGEQHTQLHEPKFLRPATQVLLAVAGLFEDTESLLDAAQDPREGFRKQMRAEYK